MPIRIDHNTRIAYVLEYARRGNDNAYRELAERLCERAFDDNGIALVSREKLVADATASGYKHWLDGKRLGEAVGNAYDVNTEMFRVAGVTA